MNILFVTWDGPQVSYLEGLFLPIFQALQSEGIHFHILQFTWGNNESIEARRIACQSAGCGYEAIKVIRKPIALGSLVSAVTGSKHITRTIKQQKIDIVMPRSTLPALSTLLALRNRSEPLVFDADGLPLDERVDFSGQSSSGFVYRLLRDIEAQAVRRADVVLTRSTKAVHILLARAGSLTSSAKFHIVSNGRDTKIFTVGSAESRATTRASLGLTENTPLLVYAGSIGPQYCITEMLRLFELVLEKNSASRLLILTGSPDLIHQMLKSRPKLIELIIIKSVTTKEVPTYLACADLGLAFRQTTFSMQGVSPIKIGEYLLCGLPLVATSGIGDTCVIDTKVGHLVKVMNEVELQEVADWFIGEVLPVRAKMREQCRYVGTEYFSLEACVKSYKRALASIVQDSYE